MRWGVIGVFALLSCASDDTNPLDAGSDDALDSGVIVDATMRHDASDDAGTCAEASNGCTALPPNVVAWWRGERNGRNEFDASALVTDGAINFPCARVGFGFGLDRQRYLVGDRPLLLSPPFTVEGWIESELNCEQCSGAIIRTDGFELIVQSNVVFGSTLSFHDEGTFAAAGIYKYQPTHFAVVRDVSSVLLYVDGKPSQVANDAGSPTFDGGLRVGEDWSGWIDELTIYDRALGQQEIKAIIAAAGGGKCP
jgi:hypothetical protein